MTLKANKLIYFVIFLFIFLFNVCLSNAASFNINSQKIYTFYKENYFLNGSIIDTTRGNITTSEGQAYFLFACLENNDKTSFDLAFNWTNENLQRKDGLYSWLYGKNIFGKYVVLDSNSASDADVHIARSLLTAYEKWHQKEYLDYAYKIMNSIWSNETKVIDDRRVLMPGAIQSKMKKIEINPSYFAPYSFKLFKKYDKSHNWDELVDSSYYYLILSMSKTKTGLPPNWFLIKNNEIVLEKSKRSDFSYDAVRVFWRIYSDYENTKDKRALIVLNKSQFFIENWKEDSNFYTNYQANGLLRDTNKPLGSIMILIPAISLFDKNTAVEIFNKEIKPHLNKYGNWKNKNDYYEMNLLLFGEYMYINQSFLK